MGQIRCILGHPFRLCFLYHPRYWAHRSGRSSGGLEGAVSIGGLSALGAGLYSIGISKDSVIKYETALKSDKYLVIAHGTIDEVAKAKEILDASNVSEVAVHHG